MVHKRGGENVMITYYNIIFHFALLDAYKLQILGINPSLLFFILFIGLFLLCYLLIQPLVAILVARHTINLLSYVMSSLLIIMICLIILHLPNILPTIYLEHRSLILKNAFLAIGTIGVMIAGFYYTKHLLKLK